MEKSRPDYNRIYNDMINIKLPHLKKEYSPVLSKKSLSALDVLDINRKLFGLSKDTEHFNQRHRAYNKSDIFAILSYQKKHRLTNSQVALHFKLSRNTVTKWRKIFLL